MTFWAPYNDEERGIGLRACLLVWTVTGFKLVPREFQLEATIAIMTGKDSLVDVGTGYGKTFCMIIPCLMDPWNHSIVFSPLKRLQAVQVLEFEQYGIKTLAINEDTPNKNPNLWKVRRSKGLRRPSCKMPSASSMRCSRDFDTLRGSGALESSMRTGNTKEFSGEGSEPRFSSANVIGLCIRYN